MSDFKASQAPEGDCFFKFDFLSTFSLLTHPDPHRADHRTRNLLRYSRNAIRIVEVKFREESCMPHSGCCHGQSTYTVLCSSLQRPRKVRSLIVRVPVAPIWLEQILCSGASRCPTPPHPYPMPSRPLRMSARISLTQGIKNGMVM